MFYFFQEEQKELDEITAKRQKRGKVEDDKPGEEKTILHGNGIFLVVLAYCVFLPAVLISKDGRQLQLFLYWR